MNVFPSSMMLELAVRSASLVDALSALRSGADVNKRAPDGFTPLMIASALGHLQMVDILITAGADVLAVEPRMGASALHKAAQAGNADVIDVLLKHGAFIDQQTPSLGHTALMDAVLHKNAEAVRLLLKRNARTSIRNYWQQTAWDLAQLDRVEAIIGLLEAHDVENYNRQPNSLLSAVKAGDCAAVNACLASGLSVEDRMAVTGEVDDDYTPLGLAVRSGHTDIVKLLLNAGADPRRVFGLMKGTAVHEAAFLGKAEVLRVFTTLGTVAGRPAVELDSPGPYNGLTPLHDAVWQGHVDAVRILIDAGAPLKVRTHAGLTPKEMAMLYGYNDIAALLAAAEATSVSSGITARATGGDAALR